MPTIILGEDNIKSLLRWYKFHDLWLIVVHIGVSNGLIVAKWLSEYRKTDGEIAPNLIHQVGRIDSITADKAYDQSRVYEAANDALKYRGQINIYPRANAVYFSYR